MKRSAGVSVVITFLMVAPASASPSGPPTTPPRDQWFAENDTGHFTDGTNVRIDQNCLALPEAKRVACSLKAFERKPFVVIALTDSGINPYHLDFRAPEFTHHPSRYIEGFPSDAQTLRLSLSKADSDGYDTARTSDDHVWEGVKTNKLYWIPGTRVIGGISIEEGGTSSAIPGQEVWPERPILDDHGHGTATASVAAGQFFGSNPEALIVEVEGTTEASVEWATKQPWIDIVSNSWGNLANLPLGDPESTRVATRRGQSVVWSAGNGLTYSNSSQVPWTEPVNDPCECATPDSDQSITDPYGGPSWMLTVGAVSPVNGQDHWWHSYPVDVSSFGSKWRAAGVFGVRTIVDKEGVQSHDFGGTSCATPIVSGVLSSIILAAREHLGDTVGGQRPDGVVAMATKKGNVDLPQEGPLSDGKLTRAEAEELVLKSAFPTPADPATLTWDVAIRPTTPAYYVHQGYGVVDRRSKKLALDILFGRDALPVRTEVDQFVAIIDSLRDVIWGAP